MELYGCTDETALNYSSQANIDNGSCEFIIDVSSCNGHLIELSLGWNLFGYSCDESSADLVEVLNPILNVIIIVKDNAGSAYLPDFSYNGIGDLHGGYGYQIKLSESVSDFNICD